MTIKLDDRLKVVRRIGLHSGRWRALNDVLAYLNTLETQTVNKADIYRAVMAMRPTPDPEGN